MTLDRYGHLFPDELEHLADRLDQARVRGDQEPSEFLAIKSP
jgi:hypothetical protein